MIAYPAISPLTGDRHALHQLIGMAGLGDRHHPDSLIEITGMRTWRNTFPSCRYSCPWQCATLHSQDGAGMDNILSQWLNHPAMNCAEQEISSLTASHRGENHPCEGFKPSQG
jgi:hypothetical protein